MDNEPAFLYRGFKEKDYAIQFTEGKFRFGLLNYYRKIEDKQRQDKTEGMSSSYIKSNDPNMLGHVGGVHINPMYLLCTSGPESDLDYVRRKYGEHIVKINAPRMLLKDINDSKPVNSMMEFIGKCFLGKVRYSKDQIQDLDPDSMEAVRLTYLQKHLDYIDDCEYRFIIKAKPSISAEAEEFIWYNLNRKLDYLEII